MQSGGAPWRIQNNEGRDMNMTTNISSKDFRVPPGEKVDLREWPTMVKPFCKSKKSYKKLLKDQVEELRSLQRLHYASNRYALLLIFPVSYTHLRAHET